MPPSDKGTLRNMSEGALILQLWQLNVYGNECMKLDWSILPLQLRNHHCFLTNWPDNQDWKALFVEQDVSSVDMDQWWLFGQHLIASTIRHGQLFLHMMRMNIKTMMVSSSPTWDMSWSLSAIPGIFNPERGWCLISDLYQFTAVNTRFQSLRLVHTGDSGPSSAGRDGAHRRPGAKRPRISSHCSSPYVTTVTPCVVVVVTTMPIAVTTVAHVATAMVEPQSMTISTLPMPVAHEYQGYLNQEHSLSLPISPHTSLGTQQQHWTGMPFSTPQLDTMHICDDAYQAVTDAST